MHEFILRNKHFFYCILFVNQISKNKSDFYTFINISKKRQYPDKIFNCIKNNVPCRFTKDGIVFLMQLINNQLC